MLYLKLTLWCYFVPWIICSPEAVQIFRTSRETKSLLLNLSIPITAKKDVYMILLGVGGGLFVWFFCYFCSFYKYCCTINLDKYFDQLSFEAVTLVDHLSKFLNFSSILVILISQHPRFFFLICHRLSYYYIQ